MGLYADEQFNRCLRYFGDLFAFRDFGILPRLPTMEQLVEVEQGVNLLRSKGIEGPELDRRAAENLEFAYMRARNDYAELLATDAMLTFFHHCYALKDWIKNEQPLGDAIRAQVEAFVAASPELLACADIANGSKHLKLDRPRSGQAQDLVVRGFEWDGKRVRVSHLYAGERAGPQLEAFDLANACMGQWANFLGKPWEPRLASDERSRRALAAAFEKATQQPK